MLLIVNLVMLFFKLIKYVVVSLVMGGVILFLISSALRDRPVIREIVGGDCEYVSAREGVGPYKLNLPIGECRRVRLRMDFVLSMLLDYPGMNVVDKVGSKDEKIELYMYFLRPERRLSATAIPRSAQNGFVRSTEFYDEVARISSLEGVDKSSLLVICLGDLRKVYRVYGELQVVYVFHKKQGSVESVDSRVLAFLDSALVKS